MVTANYRLLDDAVKFRLLTSHFLFQAPEVLNMQKTEANTMLSFATNSTITGSGGIPPLVSWGELILIIETGILFGIPAFALLYRIFF
jgi:hypothetical protein